jgi:hypothetical protein
MVNSCRSAGRAVRRDGGEGSTIISNQQQEKADMQELEHSAGIGDLKRLVGQRSREDNARMPDRVESRWTPAGAIATLLGALLFA